MLKTSPEFYQFTQEALGKMAGFNFRSTFISAAKKISEKLLSNISARLLTKFNTILFEIS